MVNHGVGVNRCDCKKEHAILLRQVVPRLADIDDKENLWKVTGRVGDVRLNSVVAGDAHVGFRRLTVLKDLATEEHNVCDVLQNSKRYREWKGKRMRNEKARTST